MRLSITNSLARNNGAAPARLLATIAFILAFAFQSFVAQTHIHVPGATGDIFPVAAAFSAPGDSQSPDQSQDDAAKCPLCQVAMAVGMAVGPAAIYVIQPIFIAIAAKPRDLPLPGSAAPAHVWHSRGPPAR